MEVEVDVTGHPRGQDCMPDTEALHSVDIARQKNPKGMRRLTWLT